jgi:hypothetical protein
MPTAKPRITITLTEHAHAVLSSLAQAQKVSMSSIVVDLVDTTLPVLERLAKVLQNAADAPQSVLDDLRRSVESAEGQFVGMQDTIMGELDSLVSESGGARAGDALAARARVPLAGRPPTSNRGVRNTSPTSKIQQISPMKKGEKNGRAEK